MKTPTINLNKWDTLTTVTTNQLYDETKGGYCAQGRVFAAAGLTMKKGYQLLLPFFEAARPLAVDDLGLRNDNDFSVFMETRVQELEGKPLQWVFKFNYAAILNNQGIYERAHQMALEAAIESGMFKVVRRKLRNSKKHPIAKESALV